MLKPILILTSLLWLTACGSDLPKLEGHVIDDASVLSAEQETALEQQLTAHEATHHHQVVVVTLYSLSGDSIKEIAGTLSQGWQIGSKAGYRGVLVLVAPKERQMYIDVGVGLNVQLNGEVVKQIMNQQMIPLFSQGKVDEGIQQGVDAILKAITPEATP